MSASDLFPRGRRLRWSLRLKTYLDETSEPNLANFAGSGRIPGARLVRCGRATPFVPSAMPITLSVDHASVLGGRGKRPALQIPCRPIASNSAATTTRLAGLFRWTPRSASHWWTCHQMAPSTPPSWPRWSPPCLRSGQRSESLPDAGCHLDVHMVTACLIPRLLPYKSCVDVVLRKHDKYRHSVGESLPYTRASRELNDQSIRKHAQCLLCVTSCYFVACFCGRGDWKMSSIVVLNYI